MNTDKAAMQSSQIRQLLEKHGDCESQDSSAWAGEIALPDQLAAFYREIGPVDIDIEGYGNATFLPKLADLWEYQAGYRWNPQTGETFTDWNPDWIVVADEGADPYIFCNGEILFANHGEGEWNPEKVFSDLNTMAAALATVGAIVLEAGEDLTDDDCMIRPRYRSEAIDKLTPIMDDKNKAESFLEGAGWE